MRCPRFTPARRARMYIVKSPLGAVLMKGVPWWRQQGEQPRCPDGHPVAQRHHYTGMVLNLFSPVKSARCGAARAWAYLDWLGGVGNPPDCDPPAGVDYDMCGLVASCCARLTQPVSFQFSLVLGLCGWTDDRLGCPSPKHLPVGNGP